MPFKKGDPNINRRGRKKGSRNKLPSDKELEDAFLKETIPTLQKLVSLRDDEDTKDSDIIKVSCKILDVSYQILVNKQKVLGRQFGDEGKNKEKGKPQKGEEEKPLFSVVPIKKDSK